jgi:FtsZ-binding cell division protein ZapB
MVHTLLGIVPGSEVAKARRQAEKLAVESEKLRAEAEAWQRVDEFFAQFKL